MCESTATFDMQMEGVDESPSQNGLQLLFDGADTLWPDSGKADLSR